MICSIDYCDKVVTARGWCKMHYCRWATHGDPMICLKPLSPRGAPMAWLARHQNHAGDGCLIWPFYRNSNGRAHMNQNSPSRIMCELVFGPPPSPKHEAAHSCGKGVDGCVHPQHLRWATKAENDADKILHGSIPKGEALPQAKLTEDDVRAIRAMQGKKQQQEIAKEFGVHFSCISKIINRVHWRHV